MLQFRQKVILMSNNDNNNNNNSSSSSSNDHHQQDDNDAYETILRYLLIHMTLKEESMTTAYMRELLVNDVNGIIGIMI